MSLHSILGLVLLGGGLLLNAWGISPLRGRGDRSRTPLAEVKSLNTNLAQRVAQLTRALQRERERSQHLQEQLAHQAMHDPITKLPTRVLFQEHLEQALVHAARHKHPGAVLIFDIDHFKVINDTLGHEQGDRILEEFAGRVSAAVRQDDIVARHGGDEFLVLVQELSHPEDAGTIAEQILKALKPRVRVGQQSFDIGASIGIAVFQNDPAEPETYIRNADAALYQAKLAGRGSYAFYSESLQREIRRRSSRRMQLKHAIEHNELEVHYQPRVNLQQRSLIGAEALVRWRQPEGSLIMPGEFIPIAEESSLIVDLGERVICQVIDDLRRWNGGRARMPLISLNLSAKQLTGRTTLAAFSKCLAAAEELAPHLELELTESVLFAADSTGHNLILSLAERGYRIAIDDFGTGYSSFGYLHSFPIDTLKIDRSFVSGAVDDPAHAVIVKAIMDLARNFRLHCVAEGIETDAQLDFVSEQGCEEGQGYLFGRAMPPTEFQQRWIAGSA